MTDDKGTPKDEEAVVADDQSQPTEPVEEPVNEIEPKEEVEETQEPSEEQGEEQAPEEPPQISRRQELAINKILGRSQPRRTVQPQSPEMLDYGTSLEADPEVIKQLETDRKTVSENSYNEGLKQAETLTRNSEWRTLLEIDAPKIEDKYGWLNPRNKEQFDPALADATNKEYKKFVDYDEQTGIAHNPIRYSDFVEARVELATRLAEAMNAKTVTNIAKQTAQTGLRPDGSSAKRLNLNKEPQDMTDEELYAAIGQKPPKK